MSKRQVARWNPYTENAQSIKADSNFQRASWEEVAASQDHHAVVQSAETLEVDPFERTDFDGNVEPAQLLAQNDDPFDLDIPEYDPPAENDPFNVGDSEPENEEDIPETDDDAEADFEDAFEDAFDDPDAAESEEEETEFEPITPEPITPEPITPEPLPTGDGESEVDSILRDSKESLDKETMREETSPEASKLLEKYLREQDEDKATGDEQNLFQDPDLDRDKQQDTLNEEELEKLRSQEARGHNELAKARIESEKNCSEEFEKLKSARIENIDLSIRVQGEAGADYPIACGLGSEVFAPRSWPQITYMWKASGTCHKPLYFEQVQLERYGHSWGPYLQPIMSGAHFFGSVAVLPYKMGIRTPNECVYTLGYYRPGSCAPYMIDPVPFTWRAVFFQGMVAGGAAVALP
ncbi:hypothetical protein [Adhaeretor mobilis]|uniref:Uncharacterized protein n=1 Tax=Adhaeretor mobilis TaxID=1930276 RepID=A0A517N0A1_9BACT|nr:hypothetical protein [Adhaeretor mobilis]QDT00534.1 hypothetical protein HG15A2_38720 [Adhaeretor mobilis]